MARLARRLLTPKTPLPPRLEVAIGAGVALLLLAAWCAATYGGFFRDDFVPPPHRVFTALWKSLGDGSLLKHTLVSLAVIYSGFLMASLIAVPVGVAMGSFRVVAAAIEPVINFVRYLPVTAMIPLLILWIGIGVEEKIAVIFIGTFFQQVVMVADVSAQVPKDLFQVSYTLGASRRQVVTRVLLPATVPGVLDTLRVTMGWAWTYLVVAELVAANAGLGYMIMQAMRGLHPEVIFVGILVIGLLGLLTDVGFKWLRRWLIPWAEVR